MPFTKNKIDVKRFEMGSKFLNSFVERRKKSILLRMPDAENEKSAITNEVICIALESNFFVHFEPIRRFFTEEVFI